MPAIKAKVSIYLDGIEGFKTEIPADTLDTLFVRLCAWLIGIRSHVMGIKNGKEA